MFEKKGFRESNTKNILGLSSLVHAGRRQFVLAGYFLVVLL